MLIVVRIYKHVHYYFISGSSLMKNREVVFYATPIDRNVFEINVDNVFDFYKKKKKKPMIYNVAGQIRIVYNLCVHTILYERYTFDNIYEIKSIFSCFCMLISSRNILNSKLIIRPLYISDYQTFQTP